MIVTVSDYAHFPFVYKSIPTQNSLSHLLGKIYTNNVSLAHYFITFHVTGKYYIDVSEHIVENLKKVQLRIEIALLYGFRREKTCLWNFVNKTTVNQPVSPRRLISIIVIKCLESRIFKLTISNISIF